MQQLPSQKKKIERKSGLLKSYLFFFFPALFDYNHFLTVFIFKYFGEIEYLGLKVNEKKEKKKVNLLSTNRISGI